MMGEKGCHKIFGHKKWSEGEGRQSPGRALHRHRKSVGSIPAGGPIVNEIFLNCSEIEFRFVYDFHSSLIKARLPLRIYPVLIQFTGPSMAIHRACGACHLFRPEVNFPEYQ